LKEKEKESPKQNTYDIDYKLYRFCLVKIADNR